MTVQPVIDYVFTGIIKGRWNPACVDLFKRHGIAVDHERRGMYRELGRLKSRIEVVMKLASDPVGLARSLYSAR